MNNTMIGLHILEKNVTGEHYLEYLHTEDLICFQKPTILDYHMIVSGSNTMVHS